MTDPFIALTADIAKAFVSHNQVPLTAIPHVLKSIYGGLVALDDHRHAPPAVPISKSVQDNWIVCLEDGKKFKTLKRYLRRRHNMTPDEYRRKWHLPGDYPMVAPNYAKLRSDAAKKIGLGRLDPPAASNKRRK